MSLFKFAKKQTPLPSLTAVEVPQSSLNYRIQLTPDYILSARSQLELGYLSPMLKAYRIFRKEDDSAASAIDVRSEALKASSVSFSTEKLSSAQIDFFTSLLKQFTPLFIDLLLELKLTGVLFRQIIYNFDSGLYYPVKFISYPRADLRLLNNIPVPFNNNTPIIINPIQTLAYFREEAILYSALKYDVFFSFAINNWAQFTETYGKPPRIARYAPGTTEAEKIQLWQMLQNFGTDLAAMVSDNVHIEFADFMSKSASSDLYYTLSKFCDEHITRRILGNNLSTTSVGDGGSYAQAKVHNLVRKDILAGDCRDLDAFLSAFFTRLNHINFDSQAIDVIVHPPSDNNLMERIQIDEKLYNYIGIDFPEDYWYNMYGVPRP